MIESTDARLPRQKHVVFVKTFIRSVVCELRFPTLVELEQGPPLEFQKALRKLVPVDESVLNVAAEARGDRGIEMRATTGRVFWARDKSWKVAVHPNSIVVETAKYTSFDDFGAKVSSVVTKVLPLLETPFFTRVGLRFVNQLPCGTAPKGWLREALVGDLAEGALGVPREYWHHVRLAAGANGLLLRHGFQAAAEGPTQYLLDLDAYAEDVDATTLDDRLRRLDELAYDAFVWSAGPTLISKLKGEAK